MWFLSYLSDVNITVDRYCDAANIQDAVTKHSRCVGEIQMKEYGCRLKGHTHTLRLFGSMDGVISKM